MTKSITMQNQHLRGVYLEYLSSETDTELSNDTILTVTVDDRQPWYSITATDMETQQVMTIDPDGLVERYELYKVV